MSRTKTIAYMLLAACLAASPLACEQTEKTKKPVKAVQPVKTAEPRKQGKIMVVMETSKGTIEIELDGDKAPISVANFLRYVDEESYDGTIFHRVMPDFMIQGGGFRPDMTQKPTHAAIKNEADNGLKNDRGTIAMARTPVVDSATAQFFINVGERNDFLNHRDRSVEGFGYAVFGKVVKGMDVVDRIVAVPTGTVGGYENVPTEAVTIVSVRRAEGAAEGG